MSDLISSVGSGLGGLIGSIFGDTPTVPPPPKPPKPPPPMPSPDDDAANLIRRKSVARQRQRRGRLSTIFTQSDGLGG